MLEKQQVEIECLLCSTISQPSSQTKMILMEILQDLSTIMSKKQQLEKINYISNDNGFCLLMKCVLWEAFSYEGTMSCSHETLIEQFLRILKCSEEQLMRICYIQFSKISKRKYELDLLKNALKQIPERVMEINKNKATRQQNSKFEHQKTQPKIQLIQNKQKQKRNSQSSSPSLQIQQPYQHDDNKKSPSSSQSQRRKQMEIYYKQNYGFTYFYYPKDDKAKRA